MNSILRFLSPVLLMTSLSANTQPANAQSKLVRDKIPEIVDKTATTATFRQANPDEYTHFLRLKLQEEVAEFLENPCLEEMADIVEVLEAFCEQMHTNLEEMQKIRDLKAKERGKFQEKWIMTKPK